MSAIIKSGALLVATMLAAAGLETVATLSLVPRP
jgi:hypothetical protein